MDKARQVHEKRLLDYPDTHSNAAMPPQVVKDICQTSEGGWQLLKTAMERLGLSARAYACMLKVAQT